MKDSGGRRRWPLGALGSLALIALAEALVVLPLTCSWPSMTASWEESRAASVREAVGRDVLMLGDSQIKGGLLPRVVAETAGASSYNLAVIGGQPAAGHVLFERALAAGARPRAVVFGYYSGLLSAGSSINKRQWPELLGPREVCEVALRAKDLELAQDLVLGFLLPSYRRRAEVRGSLAALATGVPAPKSVEGRQFRRNWLVNDGAQALPVNPAFRDDVPEPPNDPGGAHLRWKPRPEHVVYLRKLLTLAESRGIRPYWLLPIYSPRLADERRRKGVVDAYERLVRQLQGEFPSLVVLDPRELLTDPAVFSDVAHLDHRGAVGLSLAVGEALRPDAPVPPDRWVALKPSDASVNLASIEDLARSKALLERPETAAVADASPRTRR